MAALLEEDNDDKPDCPICGKYFAHDIFGGKCSRCSNNRGIATFSARQPRTRGGALVPTVLSAWPLPRPPGRAPSDGAVRG